MMTRVRPPPYDDKKDRPLVDPPSKYHSTISQKMDCCMLKMIDLKPENRQQSIWDLISELYLIIIHDRDDIQLEIKQPLKCSSSFKQFILP